MRDLAQHTKVDPLEVKLPLGAPPSVAPFIALVGFGALSIVAVPWTAWAALPALAAITLAVLFVRRFRAIRAAQPYLTVHSWGITRTDPQGILRLAAWTEPFGVTVLSDHARERVLLAFTTAHQTRFVGVRVDATNASRLLHGAATLADSDALSIHVDASLSTADALTLLDLLRQRVPQALRRILLSGARGERVVLDERELRIEWPQTEVPRPRRTFDFALPLEWRGFTFHEISGPLATIYQATWVRQGSSELVLVAQLPPELPLYAVGAESDRSAALRGFGLLQPLPGDPPPRELRLAIERVFMLPLRQALDAAPRATRGPDPKTRTSSPDLGA